MSDENPNERLFVAVGGDDLSEVGNALASGADVNARNEEGWTSLSLAVAFKFERIVVRLIQAGADIDSDGESLPLLTSAAHDTGGGVEGEPNDRVVEALLAAGADPRYRTAEGWAALGGCCGGTSESALRTATLLLDHGADPDDVGAPDATPLMQAAQAGSGAMVELLLERGADPNLLSRDDSDGPLNMARKHGHAAIEARLRKAGAVEPAAIQTDLRTAIVWGDVEAVVRLVPDDSGDLSPLLYDVSWHWDHPAIVQALIAHGADPNHRKDAEDAASVLETAVDLERSRTVETLLAFGADPFRHGREGTMMATAGDHGDVRTLAALLGSGVPVDAGDWEGTTALMMAAYEGREEAVRYLLERGADVNRHALNNHPDYYGGATALIYAVKREEIPTQIVRVLLDAGADLEATDAAGNTPLIRAASDGSVETFRLLMERGANVHARDIWGHSAIDRLELDPNEEKLQSLLAAGAIRKPHRDPVNFTLRPKDPLL